MQTISIAWPVWLRIVPPIATRSAKPIAMASDEFLVRFRYWLVSGGMMMRSACGTTTSRVTLDGCSPSAPAASDWPLATPRMPARTISAMNEAV